MNFNFQSFQEPRKMGFNRKLSSRVPAILPHTSEAGLLDELLNSWYILLLYSIPSVGREV